MKKIITIVLSLVVLFLAIPATNVEAKAKPVKSTKTMTEKQLANHNLSLGKITWNDDLVKGSIIVKSQNDKYSVSSNETYKIAKKSKDQKKNAKIAAQKAFKGVRSYAQGKGWWDCCWKIKSNSKTKVTATAKVEYKAVKIDERSKEITIKQTTKRDKKGKWVTTYTVKGKKLSTAAVKKLFNS